MSKVLGEGFVQDPHEEAAAEASRSCTKEKGEGHNFQT